MNRPNDLRGVMAGIGTIFKINRWEQEVVNGALDSTFAPAVAVELPLLERRSSLKLRLNSSLKSSAIIRRQPFDLGFR